MVQLYDIRMLKELASFRGHNRDVTYASWHPLHEELFVSGGHDGSMIYWLASRSAPQVLRLGMGLHWHAPACAGMHRHALACTGMHAGTACNGHDCWGPSVSSRPPTMRLSSLPESFPNVPNLPACFSPCTAGPAPAPALAG